MNECARALRLLRSYRGMAQQELARRATVHKATISSYESGKQEIGPTNLGLILRALELPFDAWCDTLDFVDRLELLGSHSGHSLQATPELQALERQARALAQSMGWAQERRVARMLDFAIDLLAHYGALRET